MIAYNEKNAKKIIDFCLSKGMSHNAACATVANMLAESALDSANAQNSYMNKFGLSDEEYVKRCNDDTWRRPDTGATFYADSIGFGLCQWTSSGRKLGLWNLVKSKGVSISDFNTQLDWFYEELSASKSLYNQLNSSATPEEASILFMVKFERPASSNDPAKQKLRADYARHFYDKYFCGAQAVNTDVKVLALSAGHGRNTPGKRIPIQLDPNETREWEMNQRTACYLEDELSAYAGVEVVRMDDTTGNTDVLLKTRAKHSDDIKANFYLAIHHNGSSKIFDGGGIVVYHYPLDRNKKQATEIYNRLIAATGLKGNRANPIASTTEFTEVCAPKADSILVEQGFMTSTADVPVILSDEYAHKCAKAYCQYFVDLWRLKPKAQVPDTSKAERIAYLKGQIALLQKELDELEGI